MLHAAVQVKSDILYFVFSSHFVNLQIRCYPRGSKLDNTFANIQKVPSQVLLLNTFRDILLVFCIDSHVMMFSMERKNTQPSELVLRYMSHVMRKTCFLHILNTKMQISSFVFATWIVQSLFYLNPKFKASSCLLWLYSPVHVRPGRKPRIQVFSRYGSYNVETADQIVRILGDNSRMVAVASP